MPSRTKAACSGKRRTVTTSLCSPEARAHEGILVTVGIVGLPFSGKRTLARTIAGRGIATCFDAADLRRLMNTSASAAAVAARDRAATGAVLDSSVVAQLWHEGTAAWRDALLVGFPRNEAELLTYQHASEKPLSLVHLRAAPELVSARMVLAGLPALSVGHPGAAERLAEALAPVLELARRAGVLLELDAEDEPEMLVEAVIARFWPAMKP
jgi:adenylate kinase family enzyme